MGFKRYKTIPPPRPANKVYHGRSYSIKDGVLVDPGFIVYPGNRIPAARPVRFYIPSEHPELPQVLAKVRNEKDALKFVRQCGLLGHDDLAPPEKRRGGDPLDWFFCHAATVRLLLELTELLQREDVAALEACLNVQDENIAQHVEFVVRHARVEYAVRHEIFGPMGFGIGGKDMLTLAREVRRKIINANICGVHPFLCEVDGKDILAEGINALIEGVYQHVADIVAQHRTVRKCAAPDCRQPFVQRTKRQKFCEPLSGKDSQCAERIRARRRKQP